MAFYTYSARLLTARFSPDWSEVTETYSNLEVRLDSSNATATSTGWGGIDGTGLALLVGASRHALDFEPIQVQRLVWDGGVSDVLWIVMHVRGADDQVLGFDSYYIELGGTPLPQMSSLAQWHVFRDNAELTQPTNGPFREGRAFKWSEGVALEQIDGTSGKDQLLGAGRDDVIFGHDGRDALRGYAGNDSLRGGAHNDKVWGGDGDDLIYGDGGHDLLYGDGGDDRIFGGRANDTLDGGAGNDRLSGNAGADMFIFATGYGTDRVLDFNVAEGDRIQLSSGLWSGNLTAFDVITQFGKFSAGRVILTFEGGDRLYLHEGAADGLVGLHGAIDII
jgi:Ca2+-binding RTX toxin-like protein